VSVRYRLGIDIGGTFTDLALAGDGGPAAVVKVPSTPDDYARGVVDGVRRLLALTGRAPEDVAEVVHGTTVATNTLLQGRGARTGLLTTRGFRDVLEIRRMRVPRMYDLTWEKPPPLVARALRLEVDERLDHTGAVLRPLDEDGAAAAIRRLLDAGVEAIAVCLLHAYANPAHEARLGALLRDLAPGVYCSLSHEVLPQIQEYERTSTTVVNAYLGPAVGRYLERTSAGLASLGVRAPLLVMQSNGGSMTAAAARRLPAQLVESGPAAGVIAAAALGRISPPSTTGPASVGFAASSQFTAAGTSPPGPLSTSAERGNDGRGLPENGVDAGGLGRMLLTLDMGGTTAKAALLRDGRVPLAAEAEIGAGVTVANRLNRGGGYLLSLPTVDLVEVGAGGGSLLWIDAGGVMQVGPQSAGAAPGPACYATGGTAATLTDANVVLGYLNPEWLLAGALRLDAAAARRALAEQIARPLGLSLEAAAFGARTIAAASMVRAVRAVSAERGHDPQEATLVAFGGNGPLHATAVAQELGVPRVLVPPSPGLFSAFGLLAAEVEHHFLRTHLRRLDEVDPAALQRLTGEMAAAALATLAAEGYPEARVELRWAADLRYLGQSYELTVPLALPPDAHGLALESDHANSSDTPGDRGPSPPSPREWRGGQGVRSTPVPHPQPLDAATIAALPDAFGAAHERAYGHRAIGEPVELVNVRLIARGVPDAPRGLPAGPSLADFGRAAPADDLQRPSRAAYFGPRLGWQDTPVLLRTGIGAELRPGPLIVEEYDATTLVPPGWAARLDDSHGIVLGPERP
jgi:N-methylhydantoinase A